MNAPIISIEFDGDADCFRLMATSFLRREPAGPRLFRGGELPNVSWLHVDEDSARADAAKLQAYVTAAWQGKAPKAKGKEEQEQPKLTVWDLKNAVWAI